MCRVQAEAQGEPEASSRNQSETSGKPTVIRAGTPAGREETTVGRQKYTKTSENPDAIDGISGSAAVDRAAVLRETSNASGNTVTIGHIAAERRHGTGESARRSTDISDDTYMMAFRRRSMDADQGTIGRIAHDISGKTEALPRKTSPTNDQYRAAGPRTRNASGEYDMMTEKCADASGNTDTIAADTPDDANLRPLALPCQAHAQ